jgi:peptide deformylase
MIDKLWMTGTEKPMALKKILTYPDKKLTEPARPVEKIDEELGMLLNDMAETMYAAEGVGLAATQIGVPLRMLVIDVSGAQDNSGLMKIINPVIISEEGSATSEEGCLSLPDVREDVERAERISVTFTDHEGTIVHKSCDGLLARAFQHEIDHLNGKLLFDRLGSIKRGLLRRRLKKAKETAEKNGEG